MKSASITRVESDFQISSLDDPAWELGCDIVINRYWSDVEAPEGRWFRAVMLWSDSFLYLKFNAAQHESLEIAEQPDITSKTIGLWDRDVCEIFIAPDPADRNTYFEFEIAPTAEWIDLGIVVTPTGRLTDINYSSNMQSAARIGHDTVVMAIKLPFASLGTTPKRGDVWVGNIFRCVGRAPDRGYLAWCPTKTKTPSFHVPEAFGEFTFV
ncbi:MAG: carbohydrate-binding family 9-like protein [Pyrinomonadaceae bacterium]